jgi:flagellar hook-length control protein FliK
MQQTGQNSTVLRLDPAGLGTLSVHVAVGQNGQLNVLFVPALAQTGQLLHAGMDGFRQAMTASGLNLGQADVGGQGAGQAGGESGNAGGQHNPNSQTAQNSPYGTGTSAPAPLSGTGNTHGLSAYA